MKKHYSLLILLGVFISACGSNSNNTESHEENGVKTDNTEMPGKALIAQSDCLGCHKEQGKLVGPGYSEIALKYQSDEKVISMLADKIIGGGVGNWGEIPMTAHPQITQADAQAMVEYILTLKSVE